MKTQGGSIRTAPPVPNVVTRRLLVLTAFPLWEEPQIVDRRLAKSQIRSGLFGKEEYLLPLLGV